MTLLALMTAPSFPEAKCMDKDNLDFFFPDSQVELTQRLPRLLELCNSCIHITACRTFAIENQETEGFWGGTTPEQRKHLMKPKEVGTKRFREIQEYLSRGLTKEEIAIKLRVQVASIDRNLERAKRKGFTQ